MGLVEGEGEGGCGQCREMDVGGNIKHQALSSERNKDIIEQYR